MQRILTFFTMFTRQRRPGDLAFAVAFFVFALVMAALLPTQARFLNRGAFVAEPGFWPLVGVSMMIGFGALHLVTTFNAPRLPGRWAEVWQWVRSLEYVIWFILYVMAVPVLGYLPSTLAFVLLLAFRLGYRSPRVFAASAGFAVLVVLVFKAGLGVHMPTGDAYQSLPPSVRNFFMVYL